MAEVWEQYVGELREATDYWATWNPGVPLALGVVGTIDDDLFEPVGTLAPAGLDFEVTEDTTSDSFDHSSSSGVDIAFDIGADSGGAVGPIGDLTGKITVTFSREKAIVFAARGVHTHRIKEAAVLQRQILDLWRSGAWDPKYVVVSQLLVAESCTVLISSADEATIELGASGKVGASSIDIADVEAGLKVTRVRNLHTQIVAANGLTPLFKVIRVKPSFWSGRADVSIESAVDAAQQAGEEAFEET